MSDALKTVTCSFPGIAHISDDLQDYVQSSNHTPNNAWKH